MHVLIGLGGNLGDPPRAFRSALAALGDRFPVVARSQLYRSRALGPPQPAYWNMAAIVRTDRPLLALLDACAAEERAAGRRRDDEQRWGPRTLDLDLLLADGCVHRGPRLVVPHPRFAERAFALLPAAEVAPDWAHPLLGATVAELAAAIPSADGVVVDSSGRGDR